MILVSCVLMEYNFSSNLASGPLLGDFLQYKNANYQNKKQSRSEVHGIFTSDLTGDLHSDLLLVQDKSGSEIVIVFLHDADDFLQRCCCTNSL